MKDERQRVRKARVLPDRPARLCGCALHGAPPPVAGDVRDETRPGAHRTDYAGRGEATDEPQTRPGRLSELHSVPSAVKRSPAERSRGCASRTKSGEACEREASEGRVHLTRCRTCGAEKSRAPQRHSAAALSEHASAFPCSYATCACRSSMRSLAGLL